MPEQHSNFRLGYQLRQACLFALALMLFGFRPVVASPPPPHQVEIYPSVIARTATNPESAPIEEELPPLSSTRKAVEVLKRQVKQLADERHQLSEDQARAVDMPSQPNDMQLPKPEIFNAIDQELRQAESLQSRRLSQLKSKIQHLEALLQRSLQAGPALDPAQPHANVPNVADATANADPVEPSVKQDADSHPFPVTDEPVDRIALADNLFGTGELHLALEIYEKINSPDLGDDHAWVEYQIACCLRRMGDTPAAEKHYRIVAGMPGQELLGEKARWWLDLLGKRRELQDRIQRLDAVLHSSEPDHDKP